MPSRRHKRAGEPTTPAQRASLVLPASLIAVAAILSLVGGLQYNHVWQGLPLPRISALNAATVQRAFERGQERMNPSARAGLILSYLSNRVTDAIQRPDQLEDARIDVRNFLGHTRDSQVGRLQLATLIMLEQDRAGTPPADWWPRVQPWLADLDGTDLRHFQTDLIRAYAGTYRQLGLPPGLAERSARSRIGFPHGPFLQTFTDLTQRMEAGLTNAGDNAAAADCRRVRRELLRAWIVEPVSPDLRLLAVDLLSRELTADAPGSSPATASAAAQSNQEIATALRKYRRLLLKYLNVCGAELAPLLICPTRQLEVAPSQKTILLNRLGLAGWLLGSVIGSGLTALAGWVLARGRPPVTRGAVVTGMLLGTLLLLMGVLWPTFFAESVETDFLRAGAEDGDPPVHPFIAAAVAVFILMLTPLLLSTRQPGAQRRLNVATPAIVAWLLLVAALAAANPIADASMPRYDARVKLFLDAQLQGIPMSGNLNELTQMLSAWQIDQSGMTDRASEDRTP